MIALGGFDIAVGLTIGGAVDLLLWASIVLMDAILGEIAIACRRLGSAHVVASARETTGANSGRGGNFAGGRHG